MGELRNELELIGFPSDKTFSLKEVKKAFRRKSHLMLPEKSLGAQNAHSRFEELNAAFVKILHHFSESKGEDVSELVPGEIDVKRAMFVISIRKGSVPHWRRVIKGDLNMEMSSLSALYYFMYPFPQSKYTSIKNVNPKIFIFVIVREVTTHIEFNQKNVYPTVIIGSQKKANFIQGAEGRGIRYVVYFNAGLDTSSGQQIKVNLVLYENELLQVSGSGYFLWTMDNFQVRKCWSP